MCYRLQMKLLTMMWFFEECFLYILKQEFSTAKANTYILLDLRSVVSRYRCHMNANLVCLLVVIMASFIYHIGYLNLKRPHKSQFIANSGSCTITELSILYIYCPLVCDVFFCFCHFAIWRPWSGVVLDCIDS